MTIKKVSLYRGKKRLVEVYNSYRLLDRSVSKGVTPKGVTRLKRVFL